MADVARFAYRSGWRRGEILSLRWSDVDRDGRVIRLRAAESKNGHGRVLVLEGDLVALIERRAEARTIKAADGTTRMVDLVFHRGGEPIVDVRKAWATACTKAGVPGRPLYDCRRTAARNLIRAGVTERVAMAVTGHRTRSMFDRYNIVSEADLRDAAAKAQAYVDAQPATSRTVVPMELAR